MPIGLTSSCGDTVYPRSCTLDSTLAFVCDTRVAHMYSTHECGTYASSLVCARHDLCHVEVRREEQTRQFHFYFSYEFACYQCIHI